MIGCTCIVVKEVLYETGCLLDFTSSTKVDLKQKGITPFSLWARACSITTLGRDSGSDIFTCSKSVDSALRKLLKEEMHKRATG